MSSSFHYDEVARQRVEQLVRSARRYVRPSDELRPRTLEAARANEHAQQLERRLGALMLAVVLLVACCPPVIQWASLARVQAASPSSTEIQDRAFRYASQPDVGSHWGLTEAFTQMRRHQATQLGHSLRTIK